MRFKRSRRGGGRSGALRRRSARDPGATRPAPSPTPAASSATPAPMHVRSAPHSMREPSSRRLRSARHVWRAEWSSSCHFLVRARRLSCVKFVDCILEGVKSCRKFQFRTVQDSGSGSGQSDLGIVATAAAAAHLLTADRDVGHLSPQFIKLVRIDPTSGASL
jgi:hypothetical protein